MSDTFKDRPYMQARFGTREAAVRYAQAARFSGVCEVLSGAEQYERLAYPEVSVGERAEVAERVERLETLVRLQNALIVR